MNQSSFKDSIVKGHLARVDTIDYYDTLNEDYRMLRAYINNDTSYFQNVRRNKELYEEGIRNYPSLDTCVHLQTLSELPVDEVYRFSHGQSFCYHSQIITITRKQDTVRLHYLEFSVPEYYGKVVKLIRNGQKIVIGPGCAIAKEFERRLSMKDWQGLEEKLYEADYWGLKPDHYANHMDGSFWRVEGCKRNKWTSKIDQNYSVRRHCPCGFAFEAIGKYFLKLSGEKTVCGEFF